MDVFDNDDGRRVLHNNDRDAGSPRRACTDRCDGLAYILVP